MENKHLSSEISKEIYKKIFNNSQYPCFIWKKRGGDLVLIDYNKKGKEITKGGIKDILGVKVSEYYSDRPEIIKDLNRCVSDKISFSKEIQYEYRTIDKKSYLKVFYDYIPHDMVLISTHDITKRRKAEKALKKAEEEKSLIFNSISEHIVFQNLNHEVIWANQSAAESVESNAEELIGKKCFEIWNNRTKPCEGCPVEKAIITGRVEENKIKDPSGKYWDIKGFPVKSEKGQIIGVVEVTEDITDRVKAEEALIESEEKYKTVFQNTGNATGIIEKDTTISIVNDRFEELIGYRKEEIEGKMSWKDLILEKNDLKKMEGYHYKRREDPKSTPRSYETKIVDKEGKIHDILLNVDMIPGTDKSVASLTDITYQKRIQNALKESEDKFKLIAEQSLMGIGILQDDVFKYVNQQFVGKAGYSKEEITKWKPGEFLKLIHPNYRDFVKQQARKKQEAQEDFETHYEFKAVRKNGEIYWEEIYSKPIKYQGKYADLVTTIEITDRKKAEKELKKSQERYYNAYNRAEFYKDLFAHDINNILQNVRSANELLKIYYKEKEKGPKFEEMIDVIESQVLRGANLISNVRKLSLIDDENIDLKPKSIKKVLRDVIAEIKQKYSTNRLQIYVQKPEGELLIHGNDLLYDVFKNILLNSIKYNDNKMIKINIIISEMVIDGKMYYKLEFKDNGRGIRDERKESIFQRDYSKNEKGKGIGLGLSLVKRILDTYQALIEVENRVKNDYQKGSNFIIKIPKLN